MKSLIRISLLILFSFTFAFAPYTKKDKDVCDCKPTTNILKQDRSHAKHETGYDTFSTAKNIITPETIIGWEKKYSLITKNISGKPNDKTSIRRENTPEDSLYTLDGWLYYVGREKNDCDFHIEIGPQNPKKPRVVVEVTIENCSLCTKIRNTLRSEGDSIFNFSSSNKKKCHYKKGIHCQVIGLGFYDVAHKPYRKKSKKTHKRYGKLKSWGHGDRHTVETSWELHPVKDIIFTPGA